MRLTDTIGMAAGAILRNKARSFLTTLGIIIGVASVIAMVHLGQSATLSVTSQIANMGTNLLILQPGSGERGPGGRRVSATPFTTGDQEALVGALAQAEVASIVTSTQALVWGGASPSAAVLGATPSYFGVRDLELSAGRALNDADVAEGAKVCVVGATLRGELFAGSDPLGEVVRVGRASCEVVGVLASKGATFGEDVDDSLLMPLTTVQRRLTGDDSVRSIYVSAHSERALPYVSQAMMSLMRERRGIGRGQADDFHVRDMQELSETLEGTTRTLTYLLAAIAAVSLLVGGIGIMNIMLVSVSERTREIGVRLAIGALVRDVLAQFLAEAVALSMLGGLAGVALGVGATWVATRQMNLPFVLSPDVLLLGFGFAALIGVVFGYVPARKAAHLNPIEALRYE